MVKTFFILLALSQNPTDSTVFQSPHEIFKICSQLEDQGKVKEAIDLYNKISPSDTSYIEAQSRLMNAYNSLEIYDSTISIGIRNKDELSQFRKSIYITLGNAYMRKKEYDKGLEIYKEGHRLFPYNHILLYNIGYAYFRLDDYPNASKHLQESVKINPFYSSPHVLLGYISMLQGHISKSILSYLTYLAINPDDNNILIFIENLAKDAIRNEGSINSFSDNKEFEYYDNLIKSKAALDNRFKIDVDFNASIIRQAELLFSKLKYNPESNDFWMRLYVPLYTSINKKGLTTSFLYFILQSTKNEDVINYIKKNDKEKSEWVEIANSTLKKFRSKHGTEVNGQKSTYSYWYFDNNVLNAIGNEKSDETKFGPWEFYADNSQLTISGSYNDNGTKIGTWNYYFSNGQKQRTEYYDNEGNIIKPITYYLENGSKRIVATVKDNKLEGILEYFYSCGQLEEQVPYQDGKQQGEGKVYFQTGELKTDYNIVDGELEGEYVYYFKNGQINKHIIYKAGTKNGPYQSFFENGNKDEVGQYKSDSLDGDWIGYHSNGNISYKGSFDNGSRIGKWLYYFPNGNIKESSVFSDQEGKKYKEINVFTITGKLYYTEKYKDNKLVAYTYYSEKGNTLISAQDAEGNMEYKSYYSSGEPQFEGSLVDGNLNGPFVRYFKSGNIQEKGTMKDGYYDGNYKKYYEHGQVQVECTYTKGSLNGYNKLYFKNGMVNSEGWYVNDKPEQKWIRNYTDGTLSEVNYYINGEITGTTHLYANNNHLARKYIYDKGVLTSIIQYDSLGNSYNTVSTPLGNGLRYLLSVKGDTIFRTNTICGEYVSDLIYPETKKLNSSYKVKNGAFNGPYTSYDSDGTLSVVGDYLDGEKIGIWKWYHFNGKVETENNYIKGNLEGLIKNYYYNGQLESTSEYMLGDLNGPRKYYDQSGNLQLIKIYYNDDLTGYINVNTGDTISFIEKGDFSLKSYFKNGKIAAEQNFHNGHFEGLVRYYNMDGTLIKSLQYMEGDRNGDYIEYYSSGKVYIRKTYKDNLLNGPYTEYYENGKLRRVAFYLNDNLNGKEIIYNMNGSVKSSKYFWGGYEY